MSLRTASGRLTTSTACSTPVSGLSSRNASSTAPRSPGQRRDVGEVAEQSPKHALGFGVHAWDGEHPLAGGPACPSPAPTATPRSSTTSIAASSPRSRRRDRARHRDERAGDHDTAIRHCGADRGTIGNRWRHRRSAHRHPPGLHQHVQEETSRKQQWDEDIRRENAHRFADQRRATYAQFLQLADEIRTARGNAGVLLDAIERHENERGKNEQGGDALKQRLAKRAEREFHANMDRAERASDQLRGLVAEIDLLGSADVRATARELHLAVEEWVGHEFAPAWDAFVEAVRRELAVPGDE